MSQEKAEVEEDFEAILEAVQSKLARILNQFRIPREDAEDVLQQAYLALVYQLDDVRDPEAWLVGTIRNKCLVYWRDRRRRVFDTVDTTILEWLAEATSPCQHSVDVRSDLARLVARLPEKCRDLLRLRYGLGFEPPEVAEKLGYRPSSMSKVTNRCLAQLTRQMSLNGYDWRH